jgi:hypothetical protein
MHQAGLLDGDPYASVDHQAGEAVAVDATILAAPHPMARLGAIAIAEATDEPEHQLLEGFRCHVLHLLQQFTTHVGFQLLDAIGDLLFWGGFRLLGWF